MLALLHKYLPGILLVLSGLVGLALANLAMTGLSFTIAPPLLQPQEAPRTVAAPARSPELGDYEVILERNLFDAAGGGRESLAGSTAPTEQAAPTVTARSRQDLTLIGTVADGPRALALIEVAREVKILGIDEELPGGGKLAAVRRNEAEIRYGDGSSETLRIARDGAVTAASSGRTAPAAAPAADDFQIRSLGENRFVLARAEVEKARANIGELLKQARLEPNLVNGATEGFVVKMIQPRSLLAHLGLRLGDVVQRVNGVELNSPEKALQIFQQLREARRLTIDLSRGGQPLTLQYEVD